MAARKASNTLGPSLTRMAAKYPGIVGLALRMETEIEAAEAKRRVPVDLGALKSSIHATGPTWKGRSVQCAIVAGGPAAGYAVIVHEDLEAFHKVGQAKYIESVINESKAHIGARVAKRAQLGKVI